MRSAAAAEGDLELGLHGDADAIAERGINGDAAVECGASVLSDFQQLADETELGDPHLAVALALGRHRHAQGRDDRKHDRIGRIDGKQGSHFRAVD